MLAGTDVGGGGMKLSRGRRQDGGREARFLVVWSFSGRRLLLHLCRFPDRPCVLGRNERELAVVSDDVGEKGGDADFVLALSSSLGQMLV